MLPRYRRPSRERHNAKLFAANAVSTEERDVAARSVARSAAAVGSVTNGLHAACFVSLGVTEQLRVAAHAAPLDAAAQVAAAVVEEHTSMSAANSIHEAAPSGAAALPNDHTVHLTQAARRGDQILYLTSMIGIRPGHIFLIGNPPAIEIVVAERLGSVIIGAPLLRLLERRVALFETTAA